MLRNALVLLGLCCFVLGWQVPGHFPPWTSFQQQWVVAFGVCCIALAGGTGPSRRWPAVALTMMVLAVVPWLQLWSGQLVFLSDAALPSLYIAGFAVTIAASSQISAEQGERWTDRLMLSILAAASIATLLALLQWLQSPVSQFLLDPLMPGGRPFGNLSQPNHLATLLGLGLAATLYCYERQRLRPLAAAVVVAWLGAGLVMTQSRTGLMFLALVLPWWFVGRRRMRLKWPAVVTGLALVAGAVALWPALNEWLLLAQPDATFAARTHTDLRFGVWRALLEAIANEPWFGWGWNQVPVAQLSIAFEHEAGHRSFRNAHNLLIDLAIWGGLPLALLLVAVAVYWLWRQVRRCRDAGSWCVLLGVGAIAAHAMTEYPLDYAYFLLSLGLLVGALEGVVPAGASLVVPRPMFLGAWAACAAALFWTGSEYMRVEESTRDVRFVLSGVGLDKVSHAPPPETRLLDAWREYHRYMITPARRGMSQDEVAWVRRVAQRHPYPAALVRYALATGLNGMPEESQRVLRAICNLHDPKSCRQARDLWREAQSQYPELVAMP
jgi:O-antigen ligase